MVFSPSFNVADLFKYYAQKMSDYLKRNSRSNSFQVKRADVERATESLEKKEKSKHQGRRYFDEVS